MSGKKVNQQTQNTSDTGNNSQDAGNKPADPGSQTTPIPDPKPALIGTMQEGLQNYEKKGIITESSQKK